MLSALPQRNNGAGGAIGSNGDGGQHNNTNIVGQQRRPPMDLARQGRGGIKGHSGPFGRAKSVNLSGGEMNEWIGQK